MSDKCIFIRIGRALLPILILGCAAGGAFWLIKTKPSPRKQKQKPTASVVKTLKVSAGPHKMMITAMGTVTPIEEVVLQPQVTGLVTWKHQNLTPGGIVHQGETLLHIDARNYEVALKQQEAALEKAKVQYQLEMSRAEVAAEEWQMMRGGQGAEGGDQRSEIGGRGAESGSRAKALALREPQLRAALANVYAASNALAKAELDVERTAITAPFDSVVIDEFTDRGQLVSPQTRLVHLAGTEAFEVEASLPVKDLQRMQWPDSNGKNGPSATVLYDIGTKEPIQFKGRVTRVLSNLDNAARMAQILIRIDDPLKLSDPSADTRKARLISGAYVKVIIEGLTLNNVIELPEHTIREGNKAWVLTPDSCLDVRNVEVIRIQSGKALLKDCLSDGETIVTSHISTPVPGMKLRKVGSKERTTTKNKGPVTNDQ